MRAILSTCKRLKGKRSLSCQLCICGPVYICACVCLFASSNVSNIPVWHLLRYSGNISRCLLRPRQGNFKVLQTMIVLLFSKPDSPFPIFFSHGPHSLYSLRLWTWEANKSTFPSRTECSRDIEQTSVYTTSNLITREQHKMIVFTEYSINFCLIELLPLAVNLLPFIRFFPFFHSLWVSMASWKEVGHFLIFGNLANSLFWTETSCLS